MANVLLTDDRYELGYRRGLDWAHRVSESEVREVLERSRAKGWTSIAVRPEWSCLRAELAGIGLAADGEGRVHLRREPFTIGFFESASFVWWDAELAEAASED